VQVKEEKSLREKGGNPIWTKYVGANPRKQQQRDYYKMEIIT